MTRWQRYDLGAGIVFLVLCFKYCLMAVVAVGEEHFGAGLLYAITAAMMYLFANAALASFARTRRFRKNQRRQLNARR